jgi:hypothetical protein
MAEEVTAGCARPTGGPVGEEPVDNQEAAVDAHFSKEAGPMIQVGKKAPDFVPPRGISRVNSYR